MKNIMNSIVTLIILLTESYMGSEEKEYVNV